MSNNNPTIPNKIEGERIALVIRRSWVIFTVMSFFIAILLIPVIILTVYWIISPGTFAGSVANFVLIFGSIYTLCILALGLYGFVNYYLDVHIVTNKRIVDIEQNGFFRRQISELHLHQVQDVESKVNGFLETVFHYGDAIIQTAGERENFVFEDVPHPYSIAKTIVDLHEKHIETINDADKNLAPETKSAELKKKDEYRVEDYVESKEGDLEYEEEIKNLEESYRPMPKEEQNKVDREIEDDGLSLSNIKEGEEVKIDEENENS